MSKIKEKLFRLSLAASLMFTVTSSSLYAHVSEWHSAVQHMLDLDNTFNVGYNW